MPKLYRKYPKRSTIEYDGLSDGERQILGSRYAEYYIELTVNPPRRKCAYAKMKSDEQRKYLHKVLWECAGHQYQIVNECYESSADGNLHMHALLKSNSKYVHFPLTEVADIAKTVIFACTPKQYAIYNSDLMCKEWIRYRSPCVVVQYQEIDSEHVVLYNQYINKYKDETILVNEEKNLNKKSICIVEDGENSEAEI